MDDVPRTNHVKLKRAGTRAGVVAAVTLFGVARGIPRDEMEAATGIPLGALIDPEARVPDAALGQAWRLIGRRFPGEAVGLEMAAAAPLSLFGPLAQAARFSADQRETLEIFARYDKVLSGGLDLSIAESEGATALVLDHQQDAVDGGHGAEAAVALGARIGREVLGLEEAVRRVEFAHAANAPPAVYEGWFQRPVRFEAGRNAVVFDPGALALPPSQPNPEMYRYIEAHLELVLRRLLAEVEDAPLDRVRAAIAEQASRSEYRAEPLARRLGMSVRTLQRYTSRHGVSLRALIEEARRANARRLLSDDRLSVDEVAFLLGYSDDRAFRRAFKRWTGHTPAAYRAQRG